MAVTLTNLIQAIEVTNETVVDSVLGWSPAEDSLMDNLFFKYEATALDSLLLTPRRGTQILVCLL